MSNPDIYGELSDSDMAKLDGGGSIVADLHVIESIRKQVRDEEFDRNHKSLMRRVDLAMENARLRTLLSKQEVDA